MLEKIRESNKSSKFFTSTQESNDKCGDCYDVMYKGDLRMQQDTLNTIAFAAINNTETLYYYQSMNSPDLKEFQKVIFKKVYAHIERKTVGDNTKRTSTKSRTSSPIHMVV